MGPREAAKWPHGWRLGTGKRGYGVRLMSSAPAGRALHDETLSSSLSSWLSLPPYVVLCRRVPLRKREGSRCLPGRAIRAGPACVRRGGVC